MDNTKATRCRRRRTGCLPLPFCHVHLRACRPLPELLRTPPTTPGEHLKRRRFDLGHTQAQAAEEIGVGLTAVCRWENEGAPPFPRSLPAFERYLGYLLAPTSVELGERLRAWREKERMSRTEAARRLGIAGKTLSNLEDGTEVTLRVRMEVGAKSAGRDDAPMPAATVVPACHGYPGNSE